MLKKLLFSLGALGVAGGTGVGVYYLKNKSSDETIPSVTTPTDQTGGKVTPPKLTPPTAAVSTTQTGTPSTAA